MLISYVKIMFISYVWYYETFLSKFLSNKDSGFHTLNANITDVNGAYRRALLLNNVSYLTK